MNYKLKYSFVFLTLFLLLSAYMNRNSSNAETSYLSPSYMAYDQINKRLYISLSTDGKVLVYDTENDAVIREIELGINPAGLAVNTDGTILYVAGTAAEGKLFSIDLIKYDIRGVISVGHSPQGIASTSNGERLFVANRFSNDVSVIDTRIFKEIKRIRVSREPVAIAISKDNHTIFVANQLPAGRSDMGPVAAVVSVIDNEELQVVKEIRLPDGSSGLQDIAISPEGDYVYMSHILANYRLPTTQLDRGWMNTNALSIIDANTISYHSTVLLDDIDQGAANPHGVAVSHDGNSIFIALSGTDELCILDRKKLHRKIKEKEDSAPGNNISKNSGSIYNDLSFTSDIKNRIKLEGKGIRHVLATENKVFLTSYYPATLHQLDLSKENLSRRLIGNEPAMSMERRGEMLFHDATISFQGWQSCSSCHPGNARADALNWDLLNDGYGNPKNTKSLLFSHTTPPAMITGIRKDAETAVRAGIEYILFSVRPEEEAQALDAYLKNLKPVPSQFLVNGTLSRNAIKGRRIFDKSGCSHCHSRTYFTDGDKYDVGTGTGNEQYRKFDTPSLIEVWRTAPYLYNGSAATIKQVITIYNKNDNHGSTSGLSEKEIGYLVEYINSL